MITSSGAAGRLLGLSTETPQVTEIMEDLMTVGQGDRVLELFSHRQSSRH